jgi:thiol:disulfide interchange protein DsbG
MLKMHLFPLSLLLALLLSISGCSKQEPEAAAAAAGPKRSPSVEIVAAEATGFTVGSMMAANPVYVFFDPQCPHCGRMWEASLPLQKKAKFVWIPVSLLNASSGPQGAALLSSDDPGKSMTLHETSMLANQGGISASSGIKPEMEKAVKKNMLLFNSLGIEGVPYTIARNAKTGLTVTRGGEMNTAALAELIGVDPP